MRLSVKRTRSYILCGILILTIANHGLMAQQLQPYLQSPTDTSIWVSWKTDANSESKVIYGADSTAMTQQVTGQCQVLSDAGYDQNYFYHSVRMNGLEPEQAYYYRVITGDLQSATHRFITQAPAGKGTGTYRFLVLGDHQVKGSGRYETLMRAAREKISEKYGEPVEDHVQLIINDGDQVDMGTLDQYEFMHFKPSALLSGNIPIMTTVGNHETYGTLGLAAYYDHFFYDQLGYRGIVSPGGENYYSYQQKNIVFVHLSSEHPDDQQEAWVQQIVDSVKNDASVDFLISIGHRPIQAEQYIGDISQYIRSRIIPILGQTEKSTLFIGGHHHLYARGQVRDFPMYHIISGGASWDQFWGQSTEKDYDDVQMTIDYWTYQLVTIDADAGTMTVECYAAGSPKLGFTLDNILIDSFYRKFPAVAPATPSIITGVPADSVDLPYTLESSPYPENAPEPYNSVQFQVSSDPGFGKREVDLIRDFENLYGTTGDPYYLPVDIHDTVDIFRYTIRKNRLPNGTYHARVRHRDRNVTWSEWSQPFEFSVRGSTGGPPSISTAKDIYIPGEAVQVDYQFGPGNDLDWIGLYRMGDYPGSVPSSDWDYVSGATGTVTLVPPGPGQYYVAFLENDGYYELSERVTIYVVSEPVLTPDKAGYAPGDPLEISFTNAPGIPNDWIGIYRTGDTPGVIASTLWAYTQGVSGTIPFEGLDAGYYFAAYFLNNGYMETGERVIFSVGTDLAQVEAESGIYPSGETIRINYENGPGLPTDWIGLFRQNAPPGTAPLVERLFTPGTQSGQVIFDTVLEPGPYFAALFINNSSIRISNKASFAVETTNGEASGMRDTGEFQILPSGSPGMVRIVATASPGEPCSISIATITGAVLLDRSCHAPAGSYSEVIDLSGNAPGIYLAMFRSGTRVIVKKFLLN